MSTLCIYRSSDFLGDLACLAAAPAVVGATILFFGYQVSTSKFSLSLRWGEASHQTTYWHGVLRSGLGPSCGRRGGKLTATQQEAVPSTAPQHKSVKPFCNKSATCISPRHLSLCARRNGLLWCAEVMSALLVQKLRCFTLAYLVLPRHAY